MKKIILIFILYIVSPFPAVANLLDVSLVCKLKVNAYNSYFLAIAIAARVAESRPPLNKINACFSLNIDSNKYIKLSESIACNLIKSLTLIKAFVMMTMMKRS